MLSKFQPILAETVTLAASAFSALVAAVAALAPNGAIVIKDGTSTLVQPLVIMDDERMRLICVIGALGGGVLSSILFAGDNPTTRGLIGKTVSSTMLGIMATPALFHYFGWNPTTDTLLPASGVAALIGVGAIKAAVPLWQTYVVKKLSPPSV